MMKQILSLCLLFIFSVGFSQDSEWQTYYEKSGFKETPRYKQTVEYCKKLADASPWIKYISFGVSPQGRELPLLIVDRNGNFTPLKVHRSGNAVLLIEAGIHPGEIDGKDAGLMFIRDIAIHKKYEDLLDHVTILFIPIFNVDGHERFSAYNRINQNGPKEMGWRTTAQNLNLNRDFLKADTPEMKAWLKMFNKWLPDFFVDIHATDGADFQYVMTYGLETFGNMDDGLTAWAELEYLKVMEEDMEKAGYPIFPYVAFRRWHDPKSGLRSMLSTPRLSQGYSAIQNRIGFLIENHMLKDYKTRVSATYEALIITCKFLNKEYEKLIMLNKIADEYSAGSEFRSKKFPIDFRASNDSIMVDFKGFEYEVERSNLSGGNWFKYSDKPVDFKLPYFNNQNPVVEVDLPEAYIIPPEWIDVIERLELHGIKYSQLDEPVVIPVKTYKFKNVSWRQLPYEGRHPVSFDYDEIIEEREFSAGSVVIDMNQRTARVIAHILEPKAPDSYLYWGFFDAIFEQKEYAESYVMESLARKMLAEDPELKKEFEQKKTNNPDFANNFWAILNWFYSKTPYWDQKKNVYPVGKIYDREVIKRLNG
ncbi:MAG: peptidase M14 [Bacteroidetes bacterium]|nr:peptidase M14 [Bacteroidota bacterium]